METFIGIVYPIGIIVSILVIRARAGLGLQPITVGGRDGVGAVWLTKAFVAAMFWPIALVVWLARGRPRPRVVFGERAADRRRESRAP